MTDPMAGCGWNTAITSGRMVLFIAAPMTAFDDCPRTIVHGPMADKVLLFRTLHILDEFSHECLTIRVRRRLNSTDVIDALTDLFILRGVPVA